MTSASQTKSSIAVIDYGMGNLHSAAKALEHVAPNAQVMVTADPETIISADRVLFPGVGAIRDCIAEIRRLGLDQVVHEVAKTKPLLCICVGMQSIMTHSEENGGVHCLDLFPGEVKFFGEGLKGDAGEILKVPHMGWNQVHQVRAHPLWNNIPDQARFYFVHSYYVSPTNPELATGTSQYGVEFTATLGQDNLFATQFHPEKSQKWGLQLLQNFMNWDGSA